MSDKKYAVKVTLSSGSYDSDSDDLDTAIRMWEEVLGKDEEVVSYVVDYVDRADCWGEDIEVTALKTDDAYDADDKRRELEIALADMY